MKLNFNLKIFYKISKTTVCMFYIICMSFNTDAQEYKWAKVISGGLNDDIVKSMAIDKNVNIITIGYFSGLTQFDSISLTSVNNSEDIFIAKYSPNGNLIWVKSIGGIGDENAISIKLDNNNNIFIAGGFLNKANIGSYSFNSFGSIDIFLAKLDSNANVIWAKAAGGLNYDLAYDLAINNNNDCFLTGIINNGGNNSIVNFGTTILNANQTDIFIAKYDSNGNLKWAKKAGGNMDDRAYSISTDRFSNVYISGFFQDTAYFDNTKVINAIGIKAAFASKYDNDGNIIWVKFGINSGSKSDAICNKSVTDSLGNTYIVGNYTQYVKFGNINAPRTSMCEEFICGADRYGTNLFIIKYDSDGTLL